MPGQLPEGKFDVTGLRVTREAHPDESPVVLSVIDWGEPFDLTVNFEGSGTAWYNYEHDALMRARVSFHAEGIGAAAGEYDLGPVCVDLVPNQGSYEATYTVPGGINDDGIFRLGAMVTIEKLNNAADTITNCNAPATAELGALGFYEGLVIQIHHREEPG